MCVCVHIKHVEGGPVGWCWKVLTFKHYGSVRCWCGNSSIKVVCGAGVELKRYSSVRCRCGNLHALLFRSTMPVRFLAPKLPPSSECAGPQAEPNCSTFHTQLVPGGAQGAGPGFPCQNGVLRKWPCGLPHPQRWLDIILKAL